MASHSLATIGGAVLALLFLWKFLKKSRAANLKDKVVLITGASSGVGEGLIEIPSLLTFSSLPFLSTSVCSCILPSRSQIDFVCKKRKGA
jgi:hypothetical protein